MIHCRLAFLVLSLGAAAAPSTALARTVSYDLTLSAKTVNYAGKTRQAMAINGSIPGPTQFSLMAALRCFIEAGTRSLDWVIYPIALVTVATLLSWL